VGMTLTWLAVVGWYTEMDCCRGKDTDMACCLGKDTDKASCRGNNTDMAWLYFSHEAMMTTLKSDIRTLREIAHRYGRWGG
jgi:hypothetical protein